MGKEISFEDAVKISNELYRKTFFVNPFYICHNCFKSGSKVYEKSKVDGDYPLLVLPEKVNDLSGSIIGTGFGEDIERLEKDYDIQSEPLGTEFFYSSDDWIFLEGSKFKDIRRKINRFQKESDFRILDNYSKDKIIDFMENWAEEKIARGMPDITKEFFEAELKESIGNLSLLENYPSKKIFIEICGELVGFCIMIHYVDNFWIALMQKTKQGIIGLPQFLYHLKAKEMGKGKIFTTGAEAMDPNLRKFKDSLRPVKTKDIYTIYIDGVK